MPDTFALATGRRKEAIAKVRLQSGKGKITVNNQPLLDYFNRESLMMIVRQPQELSNTVNKYDIIAQVKGGGKSGQAGALQLSIARALVKVDSGLRSSLKKAGFLTRDPREKERKKYGLAKARKRYQFSKR
jgi:small subunit ribosomal protein S9